MKHKFKVGDRVESIEYSHKGLQGVIKIMDDGKYPYYVKFDNGAECWKFIESIKLIQPTMPLSPQDEIKELKARIATLEETLRPKKKIELLLSEFRKWNYTNADDIAIEDEYIKVPLPSANHEWSVYSFRWALEFVNKYHDNYGVYIECNSRFNCNYIYIYCPN